MTLDQLFARNTVDAITRYAGYLIILLAVAGYFVFTLVVALTLIDGSFPQWLSGDKENNHFRSGLELLFFLVNIIVLPSAIWALWVARNHAREVENTRLANIFMRVDEQWSTSEMLNSRILMTTLADRYASERQDDETLAAYFDRILTDTRRTNIRRYALLMTPIYFFETIGLMIDAGYLKYEDLLRLLGGAITTYDKMFGAHLAARRAVEGEEIFAETHNLMQMIRRSRPDRYGP